MRIQTLEKTYTVIKYCYADDHLVRYLCREEGKKQIYSMVCIKDKMWIRGVTKFLMEQMENSHFTDFISCFFSEECLYVLMKYREGMTLTKMLQEMQGGLKVRMVTGKNILEKILLLSMPDYFLQDCLRGERIKVSPALEIEFQYELDNIYQFESCDFCHVQACLGRIFQELFQWEIKKDVFPPVRHFCHNLCRGEYRDILEIYEAYQELCRYMEEIPPEKRKQPRTWEFRVWEKIHRKIASLKKICGIVLLMLALIFLVYTVYQTVCPGGEKQIFTSIGTLKIRESDNKK